MARRQVITLVVCGVGVLASAGCYTRTVEAKGVGARYQGGQIYEPNLKYKGEDGNSPVEDAGDWLLGPRRIEDRR